jgi:hypothetical protein
MNDAAAAQTRERIIEDLLDVSGRQAALALQLSGEAGPDGEDTAAHSRLEALAEESAVLLARYRNILPVRALSRCPFTGEAFQMAIDDFDLDGFFWNNNAPKRPKSRFIKTFFALDGALALSGEIKKSPLLCCPGPDVPYVLPRLLQYGEIKAVVSSVKIGPHTGYPVVYYADPVPEGIYRVNDWGTERYWEPGTPVPELFTPGLYIDVPAEPAQMDFDLAPWKRAGKLLWISPGDESLTLHGHASLCPYLNLPGSRRPKYIQNGEVWRDDDSGAEDVGEPDGPQAQETTEGER